MEIATTQEDKSSPIVDSYTANIKLLLFRKLSSLQGKHGKVENFQNVHDIDHALDLIPDTLTKTGNALWEQNMIADVETLFVSIELGDSSKATQMIQEQLQLPLMS